MENQILNKIKSSYIIKNLFNYIKDTNFQLQLFIYSKFYQIKLDINPIIYKEKYIDKIGFDINKYLHIKGKEINKKDYLIQEYDIFY